MCGQSQYKFLYEVVAEWLAFEDTDIVKEDMLHGSNWKEDDGSKSKHLLPEGVRQKFADQFQVVCYLSVSSTLLFCLLTASWSRCPPSGKGVSLEISNPGFSSPLVPGSFSRSSHTSDLKIDTLVATLPCAWCYRVRVWTGEPGVSIL